MADREHGHVACRRPFEDQRGKSLPQRNIEPGKGFIQEQGAGFVPGFMRLLAHGGAAAPEAILGEVGVDMRDTGFWRGGFKVVEGMIAQL